jgi:cephalosporin hydroxylase
MHMLEKPARLTANTRLEDALDFSIRDYWGSLYAAKRGFQDVPPTNYRGSLMLKIPSDLFTYESILWDVRPELIVEIGTLEGGSALWFHDRLHLLKVKGLIENFQVVSIDLHPRQPDDGFFERCPDAAGTLKFLHGDARAEGIVETVRELGRSRAPCLVVDDSAHDKTTTLDLLRAYGDMVSVGSYFVVEDGVVDMPRLCDAIAPVRSERNQKSWPTGVGAAINEWLSERKDFRIDRSREATVTCNPCGYLKRIA